MLNDKLSLTICRQLWDAVKVQLAGSADATDLGGVQPSNGSSRLLFTAVCQEAITGRADMCRAMAADRPRAASSHIRHSGRCSAIELVRPSKRQPYSRRS